MKKKKKKNNELSVLDIIICLISVLIVTLVIIPFLFAILGIPARYLQLRGIIIGLLIPFVICRIYYRNLRRDQREKKQAEEGMEDEREVPTEDASSEIAWVEDGSVSVTQANDSSVDGGSVGSEQVEENATGLVHAESVPGNDKR